MQRNYTKYVKNAFNTAEVLIVLGLIGVLAVTTLSLNNANAMSYSTATTKLARADLALKSWAKALMATNESGLGIFANITNQDDLNKSLSEALGKKSGEILTNQQDQLIATTSLARVEILKGLSVIKLENDITLKAQYISDECDDFDGAPCAIITLSIDTRKDGEPKKTHRRIWCIHRWNS